MNEHLPECPLGCKCHGLTGIAGKHEMKMDFCTACRRVCICPELRACEQRVLDAAESAVAEQKLIPLAKQGRFIITRNTKLWDQRQAWSELGWWDFRKSALAAIAALREQWSFTTPNAS